MERPPELLILDVLLDQLEERLTAELIPAWQLFQIGAHLHRLNLRYIAMMESASASAINTKWDSSPVYS